MATILTVRNEDLQRLGPQDAVDFFRELLWAEASSLTIAKNLINVPSAIYVADGGIDAQVKDVQVSGGQGIIKQGLTRYQIKTGDFNLSQDKYINEILFKRNSRELKSRVKTCLDANGTLVVVLFGWDDPERRDELLLKRFQEKLASVDPIYTDARIEIWQQNHLIGFLQPYPSLALKVNRRSSTRFETHTEWANHEDMQKEFIPGEQQLDLVSNLRTELRHNQDPLHIRVWGEAGIGKTKLVLEATDTDDLRPLVVYCSASHFRVCHLMTELLRGEFHVILVLDECDPVTRAYVWNRLQSHSPRIKLISIYNERDDSSGIIFYYVTSLEGVQISRIIQGYGIPQDEADRWARECSGSPRVAHVIGFNLINHPDDILKPPGTINIWERYIVGLDDPASEQVRQRRTVLRYIALFKRFGYGQPVIAEAKAVAELARQADPHVTWPRFQEIIRNLQKRKILQGENTLYISPKALHIRLWIEWWDTYGEDFSLDEFAPLNPKLVNWFFEMFEYAAGSPAAFRAVRNLLGKQGPFQQTPELLRRGLGPRFFRFLAKADPEGAVRCLKNTVGTWSKEELLQFTTGRREVVWALEEAARWKNLFADAARLLLALGEAENETWSNNASGVFVGLFSISEHRKLSRTGASPQERFPVLREAVESSSKEQRALGLKACDRALGRVRWGPAVDSSPIVGQSPEPWGPKTYGELFDAYRQVWQYLYENLEDFPHDVRLEAVTVLLQNARSLALFGNLSEMVVAAVTGLSQRSFVDEKEVLKVVLQILHYDGERLPDETRRKWENLRNSLTGTDFNSLMKRYVGMNVYEDRFDEDGNRVDQLQPRIQELANQAVEKPALLRAELDWLVTTEAQNSYRFAYELGIRDHGFLLLPMITEAQKNAQGDVSASFLGGYLRPLFERDREKWEELVDSFLKDEMLYQWIPELTWRSAKVSDRGALRVLELAKDDAIDISHFQRFTYGKVMEEVSEEIFRRWIEFLLSHSDPRAIYIALPLYSHYYVVKKPVRQVPDELTLRLLTHPSLFTESEAGTYDQMSDYYWTEVGKAFLAFHPERSLELADVMLEHFGDSEAIVGRYRSRPRLVLLAILKQYPEEAWKRIAEYLGPPIDSRALSLANWLRGEDMEGEEQEGALSLIPPECVWQWVDEDVENRAWHLAGFVPKLLFRQGGRVCWAREVLIRYGDREDVRRNLRSNFSTEGWWGSESQHLERKKQRLLDFRTDEENENVKQWVDEYIAEIEERIKRTRIEEERQDF